MNSHHIITLEGLLFFDNGAFNLGDHVKIIALDGKLLRNFHFRNNEIDFTQIETGTYLISFFSNGVLIS